MGAYLGPVFTGYPDPILRGIDAVIQDVESVSSPASPLPPAPRRGAGDPQLELARSVVPESLGIEVLHLHPWGLTATAARRAARVTWRHVRG